MIKRFLLVIFSIIVNIFFLGKILKLSEKNFLNLFEIVQGLAFFFAFGMGIPEKIAIFLGFLILIFPSWLIYTVFKKIFGN